MQMFYAQIGEIGPRGWSASNLPPCRLTPLAFRLGGNPGAGPYGQPYLAIVARESRGHHRCTSSLSGLSGGSLPFNVWDKIGYNPVMAVTVQALARRYRAHPNWFLERTPCGYFDPDKIGADLKAAGFQHQQSSHRRRIYSGPALASALPGPRGAERRS